MVVSRTHKPCRYTMQKDRAKRRGETPNMLRKAAKKARKEGAAATAAFAVLHSSLPMLGMLM